MAPTPSRLWRQQAITMTRNRITRIEKVLPHMHRYDNPNREMLVLIKQALVKHLKMLKDIP